MSLDSGRTVRVVWSVTVEGMAKIKERASLEPSTPISSVAISADGKLTATRGWNQPVTLWETARRRILRQRLANEDPSGSSNIDGISPFQVHRIHMVTFLQYFPDPGLLPTCSGISRYRDRSQNSTQSAEPRKH